MKRAYDTGILDAHLKRRREENETSRARTVRLIMNALPRLAKRYGLREAYIFGSLTKPNGFRKNSDADLAVEGLRNRDYFSLRAELVRLVDREVDIIQLESHPLRKQILASGVRWKKKS